MSIFRNMDSEQSNDITKHPGFVALSATNQKNVIACYESAYVSVSQRLGVKIAQGMAYETAKNLLESYGVEKQATVPQTHSIDKAGFGGVSPADDFKHSAHEVPKQADPEDGGAKEQQVKNHVAMDDSGSIKETEDPTHDCPGCGSADHLSFHSFDRGRDSHTGYNNAGDRFHCANCGEKGDADDTIRKEKLKEGKDHKFSDIDHGDSVSYKTPQGQIRRGTAHIQGDGGSHWVLRNSSKSGGSGSIVDAKNFHGVTKRGKKVSGAGAALIYGPGGKKQTNEDADVIDLAAGYITKRATVQGLMEATKKSDSFVDFHKAVTDAGYKHKGAKPNGSSKKGPDFHNYEHPSGHALSLSVNTSGKTGPYGAEKKGHVNGFFLSAHPHDGDVKGGATISDFHKHHPKS